MATPNFANRTLFHGDNLDFLRGMNSETVNLIATDPPFNKNRDFHATPDSLAAGARFEDRWRWDQDVHQDWVDAIQDDWPAVWLVIEAARAASGDDMAAYLCWLGVRLFEMHRVLREDGSLYLHIDHTAHAWVKALMDAIFGRRNFRNEIVWCYTGPGNVKRWFPRKHDTILFYAKSDNAPFYRDAVRVDYVKLETGNTHGIFKQAATLSEKGKVPEDWWLENRDRMSPVGRIKNERTGYPTQKPLALYERIIKASSQPEDIVLDPFCGCATTPVAAERLGRQWVGIDIWKDAHETVLKRLQQNRLAVDADQSEHLLTFGEIIYKTTPPPRTDDYKTAAPPLVLKVQIPEPPGAKMTRAQMVELLMHNNGIVCQGCDREFDDARYLELDHNTPRADGGVNHISNRVLLCSPCNRLKAHRYTLSGLREQNRKYGYMASTD